MIKNNKGFTLIEVIVTITVLGIVTFVSLPLISNLSNTLSTKKYDAYNKSIESAAKLYTDSYSTDMFGYYVYGCYKVPFSVLEGKNLVKKIDDNKSDCSGDSGTYVYVIKMGDHYVYESSLVCVDSHGRELYNYSNITNPICVTDIDDGAPHIVLDPNSSGPVKNLDVNVQLDGRFGYGVNQKVKYEWLDSSKNPIGSEGTISYKNAPQDTELPLLSKTISSPTGLTGTYYLKITPINVSNYIEQDFNTNEYVSGEYLFDNIAPNVSASYDINKETNNLTINLSDNMRLAYYAISTTNTLPSDSSSLWKSTGNVTSFSKVISKNEGTYYIFAKDYAGNTNKKAITVKINRPVKFGVYLRTKKTAGFNSSVLGNMYRYTGSTAYNYVCIGTLNKTECLNNRGAFMYRVIGVVKNVDTSMGTKVDMVKVIKENYTAFQAWGPHDSATYNMYWDSSWARTYVNSFPIYGGYDNLIADINWRHGTGARHDWSAQTFFNVESGWGSLSTSKKALLYASDYLFATGNSSQVCTDNSGASTCASSWIYLGGGDGNKQHFEYTMDYSSNSVIRSYSTIIIRNWSIEGDKAGALWPEGTNEARRVRPVFYLKDTTYYNSGSGTYDDPFMIK